MGQEIVDLYMSLRLIAAPFVAGAAEATAAGERMALTINAATGEITLGMERMAAKTTEATEAISLDTNKLVSGNARLAASIGSASAEWQTSYRAMAATTTELSIQMEAAEAKAGAAAEAMATKIDAAAASTTATTVGKIEAIKKLAVGAAVVAGVVAGASLAMAADFQTSTTRLQTSAGESSAGLAVVRKGILNMASEVGVSADEMSKAMYMIESASYHGEAGLGVLKAAMEGSKAEGADAAKVANALTSALRDYYPHAEKAGDVTKAAAVTMSKFVGATSAGKMTFDDLAGSLHTLLPAAMAAGVSMDDALAALASMTVHGVSAEQATQNLAHALGHLQTLTAPQAKEFALLGISAMQLKDNLSKKGLTGTVEDVGNAIQSHMDSAGHVVLHLMDALKGLPPEVVKLGQAMLDGSVDAGQFTKATKGLTVEQQGQAAGFATLAKSTHGLGKEQKDGTLVYQTYSEALKAAMGDQTGLNVALMIGKENMGYTKGALDQINAAMPDAEGHVKGFAEVQGTFNQKMAEAKDGIGALAIKIGTYLLPVFTAIGSAVASVTGALSHNDTVAKALAITIGVVMAGALAAGGVALVGWLRNLSPMTTAIMGTTAKLGFLAAGFTFGLSNIDTFAGKATLVVTSLTAISTVAPLVTGAVGKVRDGIGNAKSALSTFATDVGAAEGAVGKFKTVAGGVGSFLTGPWGIALGLAVGALALFAGGSKDTSKAVDDLTQAIDKDSGKLGDNARAWVAHKLETDGALGKAKSLGIAEGDLTDTMVAQGSSLDALKQKLEDIVKAHSRQEEYTAGGKGGMVQYRTVLDETGTTAKNLIGEIDGVTGALNDSRAASVRQANALHKSAGELDSNASSALGTANTNGDLATASQKVTDAMDAEKNEAKMLTDRLDFLNGGNIDAARGALRFKDSVDAMAKAMSENGTAVDLNSAEGRKNLAMVLDGAEAAKTHAAAVATQTHSVEQGNTAFQGDVAALQEVMKKANLTADQIKWLTDKYLQVPHDLDTKITVDTSAAMAALGSVRKAMASVASWIPGHATGGLIRHFASGGIAHYGPGGEVAGTGTESSDGIPAMLSDGENVTRARSSRKFGQPFMDMVNHGDVDGAYRMLASRPDVNRGGLGALAGGIKAHSGGGTTVINKYETHAGAVISERDLQEIVQRVVLRYGQRNNGAGLVVGWNT